MELRVEINEAILDDDLSEFANTVTPEDAIAHDGDGDDDGGFFGTHLHLCANYGRLEMAEHLIQLGADVNRRGGLWKATALTYAADRGHLDMVKLLRNHGAEFDVSGKPIRNPLMVATNEGHIDVVKYLLDAGIDPHVVYGGDRGRLRNAWTEARENGREEIAALLESHGCRAPIEGVDQPVWELPREKWSEVNVVAEQILEYMAERFGSVDHLGMQELLPIVKGTSVAINIIRPNKDHPYLVLFTNGMSERAMAVPAGSDEWQYAELVMHLPADWPHPREAEGDPQWLWPVQWLRKAAYMPHLNDTWLAPPSTIISSADPPESLGPNTEQTYLLLVPRFANLNVPLETEDQRVINFWTVVPLYTEERDYELQHGMRAFFERFMSHKVPMTVDIHRPSFVD